MQAQSRSPEPTGDKSAGDRFVGSRQVRHRYNDISDMTLWRWLRDPDLGFPQPIKIKRDRLWNESDLDAFDARRRGEAA